MDLGHAPERRLRDASAGRTEQRIDDASGVRSVNTR